MVGNLLSRFTIHKLIHWCLINRGVHAINHCLFVSSPENDAILYSTLHKFNPGVYGHAPLVEPRIVLEGKFCFVIEITPRLVEEAGLLPRPEVPADEPESAAVGGESKE